MKVSKYVADRIGRKHSDFKIDFFRCGTVGGQNANKVNSGCRITDKATGLCAEGRETRDQLKNKKSAFRKLINKLIKHYEDEEPKFDKGSPDTIRSYKEKGDLVIDHRTEKKYSFKEIIEGKLDKIHQDLKEMLNEDNNKQDRQS